MVEKNSNVVLIREKCVDSEESLPPVSIIVPNLNGLRFLKKSIPSLMQTNYPNFEIIVVDNGSTDESVSFLRRKYPSVHVLGLRSNRGVSFAYNAGVAVASGRFISFLNNDMEFDPNWLLPLVSMLQTDDRAAGCDSKYLSYYERERIDGSGGAGRFIDKYGNNKSRGRGEYDKGQFDMPQEVFYGTSLFRKDLVEKVGGFDESFFAYYDETDLCWRLHRMGYSIIYVPESVIYHIGGGTTSQYQKGEKKLKNTFVFHYYKNKLRMLIKNQFGRKLWFSIPVYLFDLLGMVLIWLARENQLYILMAVKATVWNLRNLSDTLNHRKQYNSNKSDFSSLFLQYSGVWRTILHKFLA